jgi:ATP-dependent DNA helicase RecG
MNVLLDRLTRILKYEQQQGHRNNAVSGGLGALVNGWGREARTRLPAELHPALDELCGALAAYGELDGPEPRRAALDDLLARVQALAAQTRAVAQAKESKAPKGAAPAKERGERAAEPRRERGGRERREGDAREARREARPPQEQRPSPAPQSAAPLPVPEAPSPPADEARVSATAPAHPQRLPAERAPAGGPLPRPHVLGAPASDIIQRPPVAPFIAGPAADEPSGDRPVEPEEPPTPPVRRVTLNGPGLGLNAPVTTIRGIGPAQAARLATLGVETIGDLLLLLPRRYDDYSHLKPINRLAMGEEVTVIGTVWETHTRRGKQGTPITQSLISDGSGTLQCTWFHQSWLAEKLPAGLQVVVSGKVTQYLGRPAMQSPEWEPLERETLHTARIVPVYPLTQGLTPRWLRKQMKSLVDYWAPRVPDPLPPALIEHLGLLDRRTALAQIHFPSDIDMLAGARRRMAFDEVFLLQLGMLRQRREWQSEPGLPLDVSDEWLERFRAALPYTLTGAQIRALDELRRDVARSSAGGAPLPMNRLLQGDVGSGKTVIAAAALAMAAANDAQGVIMVPTEILAEQHYRALTQLLLANETMRALAGLATPAAVALLTGSTPAAEREAVYAGLAAGTVKIAVGTHALIQPGVSFARLGLAVIDEQHRFGVAQRAALRQKGTLPHVLVMTATPIPRTLELTFYGDLDVSRLDEMPPGRQPITTRVFYPRERERAYAFIRKQVEQGRQAFVICPLVEESDKIEAKAAVDEHARLQREIYPDLKIGLVHGRLRPDEKDVAMAAFYKGEYNILVSTSVIEVGIDVPNATVIMIEGANRFGLAQLHQFRGRVGRGEHPSYCILLSDAPDDPAENERLLAIQDTQDGFVLAEKDLELRGPGQILGTLQSGTGLPGLRMSRLLDVPTMQAARREAQALMRDDPEMAAPEHALLREQVARFWEQGGIDIS